VSNSLEQKSNFRPKMIPTTSEVKSARHKLDGVLQGLVVSRRHGSSPRSESDEEAEESSASREKKPPRKRRRKDDYDDGGSYHHTYVMKLFDRSVDLAQFRESTSLYPIARAWIHNQPHGKANRSAPGMDVDVCSGKRGEDSKEAAASEALTDEVEQASAYSIPDVYHLPPPDENFDSEASSRIPDVLPWPREDFYIHSSSNQSEMEEISPPSQDVLLVNHLSRWRTIRTHWKQQCLINESRYCESMTLIKRMFDDSQANMI